jgi:transcriptional regulator with XRE-family HTH domain
VTEPLAATGAADARGARRPRTGGRVAGRSYAPPPAEAGKGPASPYRDYSDVEPAALRDAYEWWQDICFDIRERRPALGLGYDEVAARAGVSANTVEFLERGRWVTSHILLRVAAVLGLRIEQAVPVRRAHRGGAAVGAAGAVAADRVATREEVLAARRVLRELATFLGLGDPFPPGGGRRHRRRRLSDLGVRTAVALRGDRRPDPGRRVEVVSPDAGRRRVGTELL